jgi:hypothetical protein
MIIVGWSATWDVALRAALERTANRRFTTYFCARDTLSTQAQDLVQRRGFRVLTIPDANTFCASLMERLSALDAETSHPLSLPLAIATIKRLLPDPQQRIRLSDLVLGEAKQLADRARQSRDDARPALIDDDIRSTVATYNKWLSPLRELLALGAYWRDDEYQLWQQALRIVAEGALHPTATSDRLNLVRYLPLHLWYAVGIAWGTRISAMLRIAVNCPRRPRFTAIECFCIGPYVAFRGARAGVAPAPRHFVRCVHDERRVDGDHPAGPFSRAVTLRASRS